MAKHLFSWLDPLVLLGFEAEIENLIDIPLQFDETLRLDKEGCFHRLKIPAKQSTIWVKLIFWTHLYFHKKSHLIAINQLISLFEQRLLSLQQLGQSDFQEISKQIERLKSLKNDYGYTVLRQGDPVDVDKKLEKIKKHAYILFEKHVQQAALEQEKKCREEFLLFLNRAQSFLTLLAQESCFGFQEARRLLTAYSDDLPLLFSERLHSIQTRLLLSQDLTNQIEEMALYHRGKSTVLNIEFYLSDLRTKLNREVNNLEIEIENLMVNLKCFFYYHQYDQILQEYFLLIGVNPYKDENIFRFDIGKPLNEKIEEIQDHLNQLAA
ncbi:MAG: hypothetical protein ACHQUC_06150 [Chlamydiales bacterium]